MVQRIRKLPAPKPKPRYRITNWRDYNRALVARGAITLWIDEAVVAGWGAAGGKGWRYSDMAILCALGLRCEGIHTVESDSRTNHLKVTARRAQHGGAVGCVSTSDFHARRPEHARRIFEGGEGLGEHLRIGSICTRKMGHQTT